jgi:hypothetical protein
MTKDNQPAGHTAGPRADVRVHLTNPESGYESETQARVTMDEWVVLDRVLCGTGAVYVAAPDLLEALKGMCDAYELLCQQSGMNYHESPSSKYAHARAAIRRAQPEQSAQQGEG